LIIIRKPTLAQSLLRFPTIQRKQYAADLTPLGCFITAQAIERKIGQVSEAKETRHMCAPGLWELHLSYGCPHQRARTPHE
jgi:hypothetical protein